MGEMVARRSVTTDRKSRQIHLSDVARDCAPRDGCDGLSMPCGAAGLKRELDGFCGVRGGHFPEVFSDFPQFGENV